MLATLSNLKGIVTAAKTAAAKHGIDEASLYVRAGVTQEQVDALYKQLGDIDHPTLVRLLNIPRIAMTLTQFNAYDAGSAAGIPGNKDGDISITHNKCMGSLLGDLAA